MEWLKIDSDLRIARLLQLEQDLEKSHLSFKLSKEETAKALQGAQLLKETQVKLEAELLLSQQQQGDLLQALDEATARGQDLALQLSEERKQREQASSDKEKALSELELLKKQLADLQEQEEVRWQEKKELFLSSSEFQELLGIKTSKMLKYDFEGTGKQFVQSG